MKLCAAILAVSALLMGSLQAGQYGTGFAISSKGYLITCYHVIRDAKQILVHTKEGTIPATVIALDPKNDLAVLKVEEWNGEFLGLTSASEVTYASAITATGFPDPSLMGVNPKVSKGFVNALSGVHDDPRFLQISAPVQPGNSGGPLISRTGRVVGIIASGLNSMDRMSQGGYVPQAVNYAIKADLILPLLESAAVSTPKFRTKTKDHTRQVTRAMNAIALIEGISNPVRQGRPAPPVPHQSRSPWIFPHSHAHPLQMQEVQSLNQEGLWRARNEIYLRHGFAFSTPEGQHFARQFGDHYRPQTTSVEAVQQRLSPVEVANLQLISAHEQRFLR